MDYNITIVIDKNILPQLLNKKKEVRTMGKKKKSSKQDKAQQTIILLTAILNFVTAVLILLERLL